MEYTCFDLEITNKIAHIKMSRPDEYNTMNKAFWSELPHLVESISDDASARVIVLSGEGKHFCAGMDLANFSPSDKQPNAHMGMRKESGYRVTLDLQHTITCLEKARMPVIAAVQGACVGGGVDLATATDMRYCTSDAFFCIQEINIGMAADVGTLQRLPRIIPDSKMRELAYTGRRMLSNEAKESGLVSDVYKTQKEMLDAANEMANEIATKSPVAIYGLKAVMNYSRDHSIKDSLDFNALWSGAMLSGKDMTEAMTANIEKRDAIFEQMVDVKNFDETGS